MALATTTKKRVILISLLGVFVIGLTIGLLFILDSVVFDTSKDPETSSEEITVASDELGDISAAAFLSSIQKTIPTVKSAYSYDKGHDPYSLLNAKDGYISGLSLYDSRTGATPTGNYTSEAGGSIEVFKDLAAATKRNNNLVAEQYNSKEKQGRFIQVDRYIVRSSSKLTNDEQSALLTALSQSTMMLVANSEKR